jgi:hypothetical protein
VFPVTDLMALEKRPIFLSSYAVSDISLIDCLCQKVYSISEVASPGTIASMHGVLFFVLKELVAMEDPLCQKFSLIDYLEPCERAFIVAMETYEVLAVPNFENILALTMGVSPTAVCLSILPYEGANLILS